MKVEFSLSAGEDIREHFKHFPKIVNEEMLSALVEITTLMEREVKDATPTASGNTRDSIASYVKPIEGGQLGVESISGGLLGVVASAHPHVEYVELGTKPHKVSYQGPSSGVAALELWAMEKFGITEKEAKRVGYVIARKIRMKGTKAAHMFSKTAERLQPYMETVFSRARDRIAERTMSGD